jgi:hypothetical protein
MVWPKIRSCSKSFGTSSSTSSVRYFNAGPVRLEKENPLFGRPKNGFNGGICLLWTNDQRNKDERRWIRKLWPWTFGGTFFRHFLAVAEIFEVFSFEHSFAIR